MISFLRLSLFSVIVSLLFFVATQGRVDADDRMEAGPGAALAWIAQIDTQQYDESYQSAGSIMREKVQAEKWTAVLKTFRTQWGKVISRKQISHVYKANGIDGLSGECMIVTYDTSFEKLDPAQEIVVLRWESGQWRGVGYTAGPKLSPEDANVDNSALLPHTETTDSNVTKPPQ